MSQYCNFGSNHGTVAYINEEDEGYSISFHENEEMPAISVEYYSSIKEILSDYQGYNWRETTEEDETSVLFIGK